MPRGKVPVQVAKVPEVEVPQVPLPVELPAVPVELPAVPHVEVLVLLSALPVCGDCVGSFYPCACRIRGGSG